MTDEAPTGPQGFGSIRGHAEVLERLALAVSRGRAHHAYLFSGPAGVGKATVARAFAQALNCATAPGRGCGTCRACDRLRRQVHPDLLWVEAEGKQIKIQQIRALEERLQQGAHEGRALVVIVDEAERFSISAANALLKNLEEPRAGVHFVLVTSAPHRLPITVRSRCQRLRFGPLSEAELSRLLVDDLGLDPATVADTVRMAEGSVARALMLSEHEQLPVWQAWTARLADPGALGEAPVPVVVQRLLHEVDEPEAVLKLLLPRLRDQLLLAAGLDAHGERLTQVDPDSPEATRARGTSRLRLQRRVEAVQAGLRDLESYVNKHLALERVVVQLGEAR